MQRNNLWFVALVTLLAGSALAQTNTFPSSGNVGIGTTSPDAPLKVYASGGTTKIFGPNLELNNFSTEYNLSVSSGNFSVQNNSDGGSPIRFTILGGSGNVGIGTSSPQQNLAVQGGAVIDQGNANAGAFDSSGLHFGASSGEGIASSRSGTNNTWGLDFYTGFQKRMSIMQGGGVGIGTSNPLGSFEISNSVGGFVVSGLNLDPQWNSLDMNRVVNSGKLVTGWNRMGGDGEADFLANRGGGGTGGFAFYDVANDGTVSSLLRLHGNGNVGIGATHPTAKLEVNGSVKISGSGASMTFPDGTVQATAWNGTTCGGDYAESVDVTGDRKTYEPGDVLVVDPKVEGKFLKSSEPYATTVMGIYSTQPGLTGRRVGAPKTSEEVPMAMLGIVPTKVSTENGSIKAGDLLVTSSTPGYAMKATDRSRMVGALIGKALGHLDSGTGVIEVGIALQ